MRKTMEEIQLKAFVIANNNETSEHKTKTSIQT